MPEFSNAFSGMRAERPLSKEELVRAIRFCVAAQYQAIQLYQQIVESTDEPLAEKVLRDVALKELVHVGELLRLLYSLAPTEHAAYQEGFAKVEEMIVELEGL